MKIEILTNELLLKSIVAGACRVITVSQIRHPKPKGCGGFKPKEKPLCRHF